MRDTMGASCLPMLTLSSQPEVLIEWLLEAQRMMITSDGLTNDAGDPYVPPDLRGASIVPSNERGMIAHEEAEVGRLAAARRNASSFSFGGGDGLMHPPPSRRGRSMVSASGDAYALTVNPITGGNEWGDASRPALRGGRAPVVGQAGAYASGNNPILGGAGWDDVPSMRITPRGMGGRGAVAESPRPTTAGSMASLASDRSSRQAHEDSMAGAHINRMRSQGSFAFG